MNTLPRHFGLFLSKILPPKEKIDLAQEIPEKVRDHIKENDQLATVDPYTRLIGSYRRKTYVGDLKDVDVLVFVNSDHRGKKPSIVLSKLKSTLEDYPGTRNLDIRSQRRSIHMFFEDYDFHLDIVPALACEGTDKPLNVPDKSKEQWIDSDPLGFTKYLSKLNSSDGQKVVPLIRLIKFWRDVQMSYKRPKSYWLECIVSDLIETETIETKNKSVAELFSELVEAIFRKYKKHFDKDTVPQIKDPMLGNNVAGNWERSHFEAFIKCLDKTRKLVKKALKEEETDKAVEIWQAVFGDEFPSASEVEDEARMMSTAIKEGRAFVGSAGILTSEEPNSKNTRVTPHRNYG